jgi:DNA invertase Pin-like site-specific DNA recombinase
MRAAIYARVSTQSQEQRGTIGSQLSALRERVGAEGDELVSEFTDNGHSGARLDRPGLDALRDAAEIGLVEVVWCLSPDRLARVYAYQVIVLDELARHGVSVRFLDAPVIDDDPQAKLLTQVQGVIAEYERNADVGISLVLLSVREGVLDVALIHSDPRRRRVLLSVYDVGPTVRTTLSSQPSASPIT